MADLIVDIREPESVFVKLKAKFVPLGWGVRMADLGVNSGDLFVELEKELLVIERKTPEDFLASIADDRLFRQTENIGRVTRLGFVVIDGAFAFNRAHNVMMVQNGIFQETGWNTKHVAGALRRVQANGVFVETIVTDYAETVESLIRWCKDIDRPHLHKQPVSVGAFTTEQQLLADWLGTMPGVGASSAKAFLDWSGNRRKIDLLRLVLKKFNNKDKPTGWGSGMQDEIRRYWGLEANEVGIMITTRKEWSEELDDAKKEE